MSLASLACGNRADILSRIRGEAYHEGSESGQGCPGWAGVQPGAKRQHRLKRTSHHRDNPGAGCQSQNFREANGWGKG